jgi:purine-cytosine permease-like protein
MLLAKKLFLGKLNAVNEFEREPIPPGKLQGLKSFLGMYAGEHTAGTEFVIGPLFVAHGVTAPALIIGLLVGNLLAVLSWAFLCAPIAVKKRLTLYYQLERICGSRLTSLYNLVNALMFCFLAGAMISVSATAIGIPFDMQMPSLLDIYPTNVGWVVAVFIIGLITTVVAMLGYEQVSKFANVAAPWMILIFISAAIAVLPQLGVTSFSQFWDVANEKIWTGTPLTGQSQFTVWHVIFFAWFANMAMHIGMADMSILRYAKKWQYGFASAGGMFVGHYIAWIASGILYSLFLLESNNSLEFAPGSIAFRAAGAAGALCVIIAGWTTANPTIYRAGLAVQAVMPNTRTWKVTLIVGLVTTIAACFPGLVMKLLDFVALYGLILMPMGAIIFADIQLFPKLGLRSEVAIGNRSFVNWAAAMTWLLTIAFCIALNLFAGTELFFLGLPAWFVAVSVYIVFSKALHGNKRIDMEKVEAPGVSGKG